MTNIFVLHLTSKCPYNCPICFAKENDGYITEDFLDEIIDYAKDLKVNYFNFSGGEPLVVPQLEKLINKTVKNGISVNLVTSGYGLSDKKILSIINAGISRIFVSLNSATEAINSISRDGFTSAVKALELISKISPEKSAINFCAGPENIDEFISVSNIARNLHIPMICVLLRKPNKKGIQTKEITKQQLLKLAFDIKSVVAKGIIVAIDPCFTELSALLENTDAVTLPREWQGCRPGINRITFYPNKTFSLCPHLSNKYPCNQLVEFISKTTINGLAHKTRLCLV